MNPGDDRTPDWIALNGRIYYRTEHFDWHPAGERVVALVNPPPETPEQRHHRELHDGTLNAMPPARAEES